MIPKLIFIFFFVLIAKSFDLGPKNSNSYGPYELVFTNHQACKGPKSRDDAKFTLNVDKIDCCYIGRINLTFTSPTKLEEMRIIVYSVKNNRKSILIQYRVSKICEHFAIGPVIQNHLNNENCIAKKGDFIYEEDFTKFTRMFFGTSFFYGDYIFKCQIGSAKGNILCLTIDGSFKKKS